MQLALQIAIVVALLSLAAGAATYARDAAHPMALLPASWGLVGSAYLLLPHGLRQVGLDTWLLIAAACLAFVLGSLSSFSLAAPTPRGGFESTPWRPVLFWTALLGLPVFAQRAIAIADSATFTESTLINLRIALTGELDDTQTYGVLGYLIPVAFTSTLVEFATGERRGLTPRAGVALAASLAYAVMATGRTYLFLLFIALAFVALLQRRIRPATLAWAGTAIVGVLFFGLGWLFNKIGGDSPNVNALSAAEALSLYLLGSVAALDVWMAAHVPLDWGLNTLRSVFAVAAVLGAPAQVVPLVKDYVFVPDPTNVYTVLLPYLQDFGQFGAVIVMGLLGGLHALLYRAAQSQDPRWVILNALAMYPLLMQFFQDQYFSLLTTWVQFTVMVMLCFRRRRTPALA